MNKTKNAWINGLFLIITLVVNTFGALGLINGLSQEQISNKYITLITPSPSTFSIWSIIYALLIISIIVMIVKKEDAYYQNAIKEITGLFRLSCLLNIIWIVEFSFEQVELSALFILAFAVVLTLLCLKLKKIQVDKQWLLPVTFGLYTGWLFIATVVNIASALVKLEWGGFGLSNETWGIIMLIVSIALVFIVNQQIKNAVFPLPLAWAYLGIYNFLKSPEGFGGSFTMLQTVSIVGMALLIAIAVLQFYQNHFAVLPDNSRLE